MLFPDEPMLNVYDGLLGLASLNDERPVAAWSRYHADALAARLGEFAERLRVAEWTVADTAARLAALEPSATAGRRATLAEAAGRAVHERDAIARTLDMLRARARVMDSAREADRFAPRESPFTAQLGE